MKNKNFHQSQKINKIINKKKNFLKKFKNHLKNFSRFSKEIKKNYFISIYNIETQKCNTIINDYKLKTFLMKNKKDKNSERIFKRILKEKYFFKKMKKFEEIKKNCLNSENFLSN